MIKSDVVCSGALGALDGSLALIDTLGNLRRIRVGARSDIALVVKRRWPVGRKLGRLRRAKIDLKNISCGPKILKVIHTQSNHRAAERVDVPMTLED